jgi:hypothetical protein
MNRHGSRAALVLSLLAVFAGGCATPEHRMDRAANRDDSRRAQFEQCRDQGRTDCDAILNAPVSSDGTRSNAVREQERRIAYNRCVDRGGSDCDDLLHHD